MKNIIKLSLITSISISAFAQDSTKNFMNMFNDAKISGQAELMYSTHQVKNNPNPYTTAIGGQLLYELAEFNGFNAGVEVSTSFDISKLSGDGEKNNPTISSTNEDYTKISQAYLNYIYNRFNIRLGDQLIDTPLADSDDIRIIDNTFEALTLTYDIDNFSLMYGYLSKWQGTDAGLDPNESWQKTGKDGTHFGGISYSNNLIDSSIWYYDISKTDAETNTFEQNIANKSIYIDLSLHTHPSDNIFLHYNTQYLNQNKQDNSNISSSIYGFLFEAVFFEDLSLSFAYNKSDKQGSKNSSFSGFGGGTLYTNMDNMIIDNITTDRDAKAMSSSISYSYAKLNFLYAYGVFDGDQDSSGQKENIIEQNIAIDYFINDNLSVGSICTINEDKEDTKSGAYFKNGNFENYRFVVAYDF
jgi:hypothetical protein